MEKISIDLLPLEFKTEEVKRAKFYKIQSIGIAAVLLVSFLASLVVALRVLQSQRISKTQDNLTKQEERVTKLKDTQATLILLKNRLTAINEYLGVPSKQSQMYKLINNLIPALISVTSISVSKSGDIVILATAPDGNSLDELILNLTNKDSNQNKISSVSIDNLSRGRDGIYRLSLKVKPKS